MYLRGIDLVNKGRMLNLGCDLEFSMLERGVELITRNVSIGEDEKRIKEEADDIKKAVINIEKRVPIMRMTMKFDK